jgi:hypothetical protein
MTSNNNSQYLVSTLRFIWLVINAFLFQTAAVSLALGLFYNKTTPEGAELRLTLNKLVLATTEQRPVSLETLYNNPFWYVDRFLSFPPSTIILAHGTVCLWTLYGMIAMYCDGLLIPYLGSCLGGIAGYLGSYAYDNGLFSNFYFNFGTICVISAGYLYFYEKCREARVRRATEEHSKLQNRKTLTVWLIFWKAIVVYLQFCRCENLIFVIDFIYLLF